MPTPPLSTAHHRRATPALHFAGFGDKYKGLVEGTALGLLLAATGGSVGSLEAGSGTGTGDRGGFVCLAN